MKVLEVIHPGIFTTYQDLGRKGFRKLGIPLSGPMDVLAFKVGNLLVGNLEDRVGLEVTLQGLRMRVLTPLLIAITGADLNFHVNDCYYSPWQSIPVREGDELRFKSRRSGMRAYLTVAGGFRAPAWLGSASVFLRGSLGSPLRRKAVLELAAEGQRLGTGRKVPQHLIPDYSIERPVRVIMGPQVDAFSVEGLEVFLNTRFRIRSESDRMAYRLEGAKVAHSTRPDILSEPVLPGCIQVPGDGQPIILMVDSQVTGGYVKVASVITADLPLLAQAMPGEYLRFERTDLECAYQCLNERRILLSWFGNQLGQVRECVEGA